MAFSVMWLGQGGFLVRFGEKTLCIDPYLSNSVLALDGFQRLVPPLFAPEALPADMILATHDHMDHLDPETIGKTRYDRHLYAGPPSCLAHYRELGISGDRLMPLGRGEVAELGQARLMGVFADHTPDSVGIVAEYRGVKIYFTGDSLYHPRLSDVGVLGIDILYTCINGRLGNMNAGEAARLARQVGCRVAVPVHFGMFAENTEDPGAFCAPLKGSGIYVEIPEYGGTQHIFSLLEKAEA